MAKEWIDVVDTAVKIGLGGIITGTVTILLNRSNNKSKRMHYMHDNKIKTLETCASQIGEYFQALEDLLDISDQRDHTVNDLTIPDTIFEEIEKSDSIFCKSWPSYNIAVNKLRLLGSEKLVNLLIENWYHAIDLRNGIIFDKKFISNENIESISKDMTKRVSLVFKELSKLYLN